MSWFKVDDKLHEHRKARKAGKSAMGVWVLAGSWCMDNDSDGFVPDDVLARWGSRSDASKLVAAGFWYVDRHEGESGWRFHDWAHYQPSAAVTAAKREAERQSGLRGNHKRWHLDRKISDPDCEYCYRVPDGAPDQDPDRVGSGGGESGAIPPVPVPVPVPHDSPNGESPPRSDLALVEDHRPDVDHICDHLAEAVESTGAKKPSVTAKWRNEARLMLDSDGRSVAEVDACIRWLYGSTHKDALFWRPNVRAMPKLRAEYDRLLALSQRPSNGGRSRQEETDALFERAAHRMGVNGGGL